MAEDFTKPSNDGGKIPDAYDKDDPATKVVFGVGSDPALPSPLECGKKYELHVERAEDGFTKASVNVGCENLYADMLRFLKDRAAELKCPDKCKPLYIWIASRGWAQDFAATEVKIKVWVSLGVMCPGAGDIKPDSLHDLDSDAFKERNSNETGDAFDAHPPAGRESWKITGIGRSVRCGDRKLIQFTYLSTDPCENPKFEENVKKARALAQDYVDHVTCRAQRVDTLEATKYRDCERKARRLRTEWDCGFTVLVEVYWEVRCIPPKL